MKEFTLDAKVEMSSPFLKNLWNKSKYAVAVLGAAYVINCGYHLVKFANASDEFSKLQSQIEIDVLGLFYKSDGWKEAGLSRDEQHRKWDEIFNKLKATDRRA